MEIHLTPDQETLLARRAADEGRSVDDLAQDAVARYLDDEARFADAVRLGIAAADRGEFVAGDAVWESIERILQS